MKNHSPVKNDIVIASVNDSLGKPSIRAVDEYPDYEITIKEPAVLRGMDSVELRVLEADNINKTMRVSFHAMDKFNPQVSTGRVIMVTYTSMRNTVHHIFRKLLSFQG